LSRIGKKRGNDGGKTIGNTADIMEGGEGDDEEENEENDDESGVGVWDIECTDFNRPCFSSPIDTHTDLSTDTSPSEPLIQEGDEEVAVGAKLEKEKEKEKGKGNDNTHTSPLPLPLPLLRHLPNWWFSLSLSTFIDEKAKDKDKDKVKSNSNNTSASSSSMGLTSEHILMKVQHCAVLCCAYLTMTHVFTMTKSTTFYHVPILFLTLFQYNFFLPLILPLLHPH
jgi:hypothetical protein